MRKKSHVDHRSDRRLRVLISRQRIANATPVNVRYTSLLFRRTNNCPTACRWLIRVTEYQRSTATPG